MRKPLIAALNGPALGGGAEMLVACDIVVGYEKALVSFPEVRRGESIATTECMRGRVAEGVLCEPWAGNLPAAI